MLYLHGYFITYVAITFKLVIMKLNRIKTVLVEKDVSQTEPKKSLPTTATSCMVQ